jgi:expansin (peptidoglycan-binding protein)
MDGPGTLRISGGDLSSEQVWTVTVTNGTPHGSTGALKAWRSVKPAVGTFQPKVQVPTIKNPVTGNGIYLPKAHAAWGFFPGLHEGGRIILTVP